MKVIIVGIFAFSLCWGVSHFVNLGHTVFSAGGIPISGGVILFAAAAGLLAKKIK